MPPRGHQPSCTRTPKVGFSVPPRRDPVHPYTSEHKQQYPEEGIFLWEVTAHFTPTKDIPDLLGSAFANTHDGNENDDNRHRHQHPNYDDPLGFWLKETKNGSFCVDDKQNTVFFFTNTKKIVKTHSVLLSVLPSPPPPPPPSPPSPPSSTSTSQRSPSKPSAQLQVKLLSTSWHVPPFKQGELRQGLSAVQKKVNVNFNNQLFLTDIYIIHIALGVSTNVF